MFTLVVPPESACGCGSGRAFENCHLFGNPIRMKAKSVVPPSPSPNAGHAERKCAFKAYFDCHGGMSGDHIFSRTVLRSIPGTDPKFTMRGPGFERVDIGLDSDA